MKNFQQKNTWRKIAQSKPVLFILGICILIFAWNLLGFWGKMQETGKNKKIVEDRIATLETQKEKLLSDVESLKTDEGKEEFFRENFSLAKEGEDLIVVVEDKTPPEVEKTSFSSGFFSFFRNLFRR